MGSLSASLIEECRLRLLQFKREILNQIQARRLEFSERDFRGDEADLSASMLSENQMYASHRRNRERLLEIESALARIERGRFGICEETEEPIEAERLRAIPWTRLSIEGAEIREALKRRYSP
jgi:DnaK suppressor protein